jgi:hypothetical protein
MMARQTGARDMATTSSNRVEGPEALDIFEASIDEAPLERREDLRRAIRWARHLVRAGLAHPTCKPNPAYPTWTLRLVPRDEKAALVTLWNDHNVPALAIEDTVDVPGPNYLERAS